MVLGLEKEQVGLVKIVLVTHVPDMAAAPFLRDRVQSDISVTST